MIKYTKRGKINCKDFIRFRGVVRQWRAGKIVSCIWVKRLFSLLKLNTLNTSNDEHRRRTPLSLRSWEPFRFVMWRNARSSTNKRCTKAVKTQHQCSSFKNAFACEADEVGGCVLTFQAPLGRLACLFSKSWTLKMFFDALVLSHRDCLHDVVID